MVHCTAVHFRCRGRLDFGHRLTVVGDHSALGNWDTAAAHELRQSSTVEDVWNSSAPAHLPLKERREYRYAVVNISGEFVRWLQDAARTVEPTGLEMIVEDDDGYYRDQCAASCDPSSAQPSTRMRISRSGDNLCDGSLEAFQMLDNIVVDPRHVVYFVTSRLPIQVYRTAEGGFAIRESNTPLTTTLWEARDRYRNKMRFIGACTIYQESDEARQGSAETTSDSSLEGTFTAAEKEELRALLLQHDCIPVFVPRAELTNSLRFCKDHIWNLFYNIGLWNINEQNEFNWDLWNAYVSVNREYAAVAAANASESDFFWVHDYKLLMVPHFITRRMRRANIGVFMHAMFPPCNLFLCLAVRETILRSILCADLIGFQFFDYARYFITCCKRLLGLDHTSKLGGMLGIEYNGREVMILLSHSHIQPDLLARRLAEDRGVPALVEEFRRQWPDRFVVASLDRDVRLSGLFLKLKAFRKYLEQYPEARGRVLLVQYLCATDTLWAARQDVVGKLTSIVAAINADFGQTHVLLEFDVSLERKYALFTAAHCFLDTCIRGGVNMRALEYIYCRQGQPACAILSEFVGFSKMLISAIRVNPWHIESVVEALDTAMTSNPRDRVEACRLDFEYIMSNDTVSWVDNFVRELFCARKSQDMVHLTWGFGKTYRTYSLSSTFQRLETEHLLQQYKAARRRLIFLDCEGTLSPRNWGFPPRSTKDRQELVRTQCAPIAANLASLRALAADPANVVVAISVRSRECMERFWFPDQPDLGVCAGYGFRYRIPALTGDEWGCMLETVEEEWKAPVLQVMQQYARRTPGSYVENMDVMVVFQYHHSDPEFGASQSAELYHVLKDIMVPYPVEVHWTTWNVKVGLKGVSKGAALLSVAKSYSAAHGDFDFVLCVGDSRSDEEMFKALDTLKQRVHGGGYISVTVGMKPSKAMYYVNDHTEVAELLGAIASH
ncbi:trehalose-6-phosphate synthase [Babesia caballi]|uniref:Trehalose-6-phosphate synthase n=1 Tax=Babesia caballi TaxID=5871 RepID=A0AAV4LY42_BABCB|nr:trehalose-6-phosphate synthase [Babesia caballi]